MIINITTDQKQAIDRGETLAVEVYDTECVVLRKDVYERLRRTAEHEAAAPEEAYPAILDAWDREGSPEDAEDYKE